jgi:hypothetical protein
MVVGVIEEGMQCHGLSPARREVPPRTKESSDSGTSIATLMQQKALSVFISYAFLDGSTRLERSFK